MFGTEGRQHCLRREDRRTVELGAVIHRRDGSRAIAEVRDLSYRGCRIGGSGSLEPAERIRLIVPTLGEMQAQVRWSDTLGAGAQFDSGGPCDSDIDRGPLNALSRGRQFNYGTGRSFGRKGCAG